MRRLTTSKIKYLGALRQPPKRGAHKAGEHTTAEVGELFGVARSTVYQAIERGPLLRRLGEAKLIDPFRSGMTLAVAGMGVRVAGQGFSGRELARTAAVMRLTAQQLRLAAARVHASAAAARSERTAARLRALGDAVLVQADAIDQRAVRLATVTAEMPPPPAEDERPLP